MTISDIAKMAGVSSAAVSRYFNNGYLSEEKKEAIRAVVEQTGYHPSVQAQMLRTRKTKTVGLIIPRLNSSSMGSVVAGVMNVLNEAGYRVLLANTQNDPQKELEYLSVFGENQVDGIIISGTIFSAAYRKAMKKISVPIVVVGQQLAGFNSVYHDDYHAQYDLTSCFLKKGRRKLGYIGVTEKDRAVGELRRKGFCDALRQYGAGECKSNYVIAGFTLESGYEKMAELYALNPDLDAVLCATDRIAAGAIMWVRKHHPELLDKIAFGGQGDSDLAGASYPPISTLHYYYQESGASAAKKILDMIENGESPAREIKMGYRVVDRL